MSWWDDLFAGFGSSGDVFDGDPLAYSVDPGSLDFDAFTADLPGFDLGSLLDLGSGTGLKLPDNATSLADIFDSGAPGLKLPDTPNSAVMDGYGTGLTLDTGGLDGFWGGLPSGTLTDSGLYLDDWLPAIGDPASSVNTGSRPVNGASARPGVPNTSAHGTGSPAAAGAAGASGSGSAVKDFLNGNGGLNKLGLAALAAYLMNKGDKGSGSSGGWTPARDMTYSREMKPQDAARRPGAANPGGYFGNVTYAAEGGLLQGPGDGLSDSIPAQIDGRAPAQLGTGEFVVPADVTSALGGGDTQAGAQRLQEMLSRVRKEAHGHDKQIRPVSDKAMPI